MSHRQAFAWIDDWYGMTMDDVREYEARMQDETNERLRQEGSKAGLARSVSVMEPPKSKKESGSADGRRSEPATPTDEAPKKGWFNSWY